MNYINNFRYGEISKRNAGRFDTEFYQNGAFSFINAKTGYLGDVQRRPPLKKLIDTDGVLNIITFTVSESMSYLIALKKTNLEVYRFVTNKFSKITEVSYPKADDDDDIELTGLEAHEVRYAQYYTRMYFTHHTFRPFFIEINPTTDTVSTSVVEVLLNQDIKKSFYFTPSYVADANGKELPNQEGRLVYKATGENYSWYFDEDFTEPYLYSLAYPPILGERSHIGNYDEYQDDDLLQGKGNYPSGVSIISDRIYFYATDNHPQVFWMSRILGSSQWIEGYTTDSMHDFVSFQAVITQGKDIIDAGEFPMTEMKDSAGEVMYEQSNGQDMWFKPDKDSNGNYTYQQRLYRKITDPNGEEYTYYIDSECTVEYDMSNGDPIRKPIMTIDVSDTEAFLKNTVQVDFVGNDSCAGRYEMNTSRQDRIMAIESACEKIFVLTTTSEHTLPDDFNAQSNLSQKKFSDFTSCGSYTVRPLTLNNSFLFLQRGNILREFYTFEGYLNNSDVTALNHDIFDGNILSSCTKNTPDPMAYFVMDDGTVRVLSYDKSNGIQSFSRWNFGNRQLQAVANIEHNNTTILVALVSNEIEEFIGYFDEDEDESFEDEGGYQYDTIVSTPYLEIVNTTYSQEAQLTFGKTKQLRSAFLRTYRTGNIIVEDISGQENKTNYRLDKNGEITDYRMPIDGRAKTMYSITFKSYKDEPMDILALGYEVS